jgi:hypothetical protein
MSFTYTTGVNMLEGEAREWLKQRVVSINSKPSIIFDEKGVKVYRVHCCIKRQLGPLDFADWQNVYFKVVEEDWSVFHANL